jgi:hypothetical protein
MKQSALEISKFMGSSRQQWMAILLFYSFVVMTVQVIFKIDPNPYMNFALTTGSLFILGGSVDSYMRIGAAKSIKEKEIDKS